MRKKLTNKELQAIEEVKSKGNIPRHIAIIMDGNGRWAKKRNLPRVAGHRKGVEIVRLVVEACVALGVDVLTLYTFSTENWRRPKDEVSTLMRLIVKSLQTETDELNQNNIRLTTIGNKDILPDIVRNELDNAIAKTAGNTKMTLNLALSYSGRWELVQAIKTIIEQVENGKVDKNELDEKLVSDYLNTAGLPDPDLLIRSGGEFRISNFLLWQIAYSEIFISKVLWPDFRCRHLLEAITDYQSRERRFGMVSEQIKNNGLFNINRNNNGDNKKIIEA
ncbi:undecaprenyl diphosphate synthase [Melioribacter roseus P3M-2]|uniref:Isoprenyl transferase n=1 Tax=Melioribacter roseus (strain DSM 23840 / JCM 17771 / VKM B-2668 / P3M-2) TaxID=1191523 RepID=I7A1L9_MELRP|nr:isoprenyl transferase [Melioribacter roseus]AFN75118.1 undecaprenyl diphosphate synthase [Melioribacter roseus P3M-2]